MSTSDPQGPGGGLEPGDPRIPSRPLWGFALVLLPVVGVILVTVAYVVMFSLGLSGRGAAGAEVTWRYSGCPEARPLLEARLADVGLPATWTDEPGGYRVTTQLTGDPEVDRALPTTLTRPAELQVRGDGEVLATTEDLLDASVRMDLFMVPSVLLSLDTEAAERVKQHVRAVPRGKMTFHVDGRAIGWQSNTNPVSIGELEINLDTEGDEQQRMREVAALSVTLDHAPLPCLVRFDGTLEGPTP